MTFPSDRTYSFDANLEFSDNAAAYTASGFLQKGGGNGIIDLGGNQGASPKQQARIDAAAVLDVTALDITSSNETYKIIVIGSNDPAFASGTGQMLGGIELGKGASLDGFDMLDSVTGRYELFFTNQQGGVIYQYVGFYLTAGGTTPSISIEGFVAVLPCI